MTIEHIRRAYRATPFRPFVVHLTDGRKVPVLNRDLIMIVPSVRTIVVCQRNGDLSIIDSSAITEIKFRRTGSGSRRRK